ncbi:MAG: hypothetical protein JNN03_19325 [Rubrivivax sp.]|nr:hypothetical protein [Rubrivivax sp.]
MTRRPNRLITWLKAPLRLLLALIILFEEWGWQPLQNLMARIARLPVLRSIEARIARLPPYAALVVFFLPGLALLPVKIGALWLVAHGQRLAGLAVIVAAKLVGTAIVARLFTLTRPALMRLAWFAALYARWTGWKEQLLAWVRGSALWRSLHAWRLRLREPLRSWRSRALRRVRHWFGPPA